MVPGSAFSKRKRYLRRHSRVPFNGMAYVNVSSQKIHHFTEELSREYRAVGMTSSYENGQQYLHYKKGGAFPSKATGAKRKHWSDRI
jgi:hypothetical protein